MISLMLILMPTTGFAESNVRIFCVAQILGTGVGCEVSYSTPVTSVNTYCSLYDPIRWSSKDTLETLRQVKRANARWRAACGRNPESVKRGY